MSGTKVIPPDSDPKCPQCGTPLPYGVLAGLCPACLLQMGAATDTVSDAKQPAFTPPSVTELAPLFPQLEILELIGKGGMGAVYKARQKQLDRIVALKILPPGIGGDPAFAERFAREAKALAKLNHPGIVTLYEFGSCAGLESEKEKGRKGAGEHQPSGTEVTSAPVPLYYFLMEFVDGVNLRQLLHGGRISAREALAIVPQICDALQFAHDQGIVHRDIKPENILLDRRGRVKVADFGLAKIVGAESSFGVPPSGGSGAAAADRLKPELQTSLTDAGKVMGTPQYMSPEQIHAPGEVDHRADIYALGVVFYQMLTGELPGKKIEAPSKKVQIDVRLDEVVLRALEKKPELRYQQASVLKTQVETIAETPAPSVGDQPAVPAGLRAGFEYRSKTTIFGLPLLHVTAGPDPLTGRERTAKGIIAIGGKARGIVAFGGLAAGVFAFGGGAIGVFAFGGAAVGLVSFGGLAIALLFALGGGAVGPIAMGGGAVGYLVYAGGGLGVHVYDAMTHDPVAQQFFLPWAKVLMANLQWINFVVLAVLLLIGIGVPLWLQRRHLGKSSPGNPPDSSGPRTPRIEPDTTKAQSQRTSADSESRPMKTNPPSRYGRLAFGLFLVGTLGTLLLMTVSYRHDMALIFGATALVLAFVFGLMSWRERLGRFVVLTLGSVLGAGGLVLLVYLGAFGPARRAAVERARAGIQTKLAQLERAKAAAEQLRRVAMATNNEPSFGPVIERTIYRVATGTNSLIQFKTGALSSPPSASTNSMQTVHRRSETQDADAAVGVIGADVLSGFDMVMVRAPANCWDELTPIQAVRRLEGEEHKSVQILAYGQRFPETSVFKTRDGGIGILQVLQLANNPPGLKVRYKFLAQPPVLPPVQFDPEAAPESWAPVLLPGEQPDPAKLLTEAKELTSKSRYAEALARYVWYHHHAQAYGESFRTTQRRLTGISEWVELGRRYPKARTKLLEIRDTKIREIEAGRGHSDILLDVVSINDHLQQEAAMVELLKTTYAHDPDLVQQSYFHIESLLVARGEYEFCFKLMGDPQRRFKLIQNVWETQKKSAAQSTPELPQRLLRTAQSLSATNPATTNDSAIVRMLPPRPASPDRAQQADNYFVGQVRQLVEILVGVGRKAEAETIQTAALAVLTLPELQTAVSDAETRVRERRPSAPQHAFGPVVELTLRDPSENQTNCFIDFETGKVVIPPAELQLTNRAAVWDWAKAQDVDAVANTSDPSIRGLLGYELTVVRLADKEWEQIADGKLGGEISKQAWNNSRFGGLPSDAQAVLTVNTVATDPNPSKTYGFRTSAGNLGMLQLVEYTDSPRGSVKIRYKLASDADSSRREPFASPSRAWQSTNPIAPPDFDAFFPDDAGGGMKLDGLWLATDKDSRPDAEIFATVRSGLRRTTQHRTAILRWIGNRYIWNKSPQHPDAIEIMYHAVECRTPNADRYGTRHYAVYFGLSVVKPKTPAILKTLADIAMNVDDPNDLDRIAWGSASQREELLKHLEPYATVTDSVVQEKAKVVTAILRGELKAFEWATERARKKAQENFSSELPQLKSILAAGPDAERMAVLRLITRERLTLIMDDSFVAAYARCAESTNAAVRNQVARQVGENWIWSAKVQNSAAIDLMLKLSTDANRDVRNSAVYFGLSTVRDKSESVVRQLVQLGLAEQNAYDWGRIIWGLKPDRALVTKVLQEYLADPTKAPAAQKILDALGQE